VQLKGGGTHDGGLWPPGCGERGPNTRAPVWIFGARGHHGDPFKGRAALRDGPAALKLPRPKKKEGPGPREIPRQGRAAIGQPPGRPRKVYPGGKGAQQHGNRTATIQVHGGRRPCGASGSPPPFRRLRRGSIQVLPPGTWPQPSRSRVRPREGDLPRRLRVGGGRFGRGLEEQDGRPALVTFKGNFNKVQAGPPATFRVGRCRDARSSGAQPEGPGARSYGALGHQQRMMEFRSRALHPPRTNIVGPGAARGDFSRLPPPAQGCFAGGKARGRPSGPEAIKGRWRRVAAANLPRAGEHG